MLLGGTAGVGCVRVIGWYRGERCVYMLLVAGTVRYRDRGR